MKEKIFHFSKKVINHELISGSSYLFLGTTIANFFAFVFNLFLVRRLSYGDYGELAAIISLLTLVSIPAQSLQPIIIQFSTKYLSSGNKEKLVGFYYQAIKVLGVVGLSILVLSLAASPFLKSFLHLHQSNYIFLAGLTVAVIYMSIANTGLLQSLLNFKLLAFTTALGGLLKLGFGIALIVLGFKLYGALTALLLSFFIPFVITFFPLSSYIDRKQKRVKVPLKEIASYAIPTVLAMISLSALTSTDLLLVKHFFSAKDAGLYAGLSLVGRIIFYFTFPITSVMFPLVIKRFEEKRSFQNLFYVGLLLVSLPSILLTLFYVVFPQFTIAFFLGGKAYHAIIPYLGIFGLFLCIFSLMNVFVTFFLSLKRTEVSVLVVMGVLAQAVGISMYHKTFLQVILTNVSVSLVLLLILLLYYIKEYAAIKTTK